MITLNFEWHFFIMLGLELLGLSWALHRSRELSAFGLPSARDFALVAYVVVSVIAWLIYGGIVWW